jgi:hypothetical protein
MGADRSSYVDPGFLAKQTHLILQTLFLGVVPERTAADIQHIGCLGERFITRQSCRLYLAEGELCLTASSGFRGRWRPQPS